MSGLRARNIDQVIDNMTLILDRCITHGDRRGYFTGLYRLVTKVVRKRCDEKYFEDNERMRELDTNFANRYFQAVDAYQNGQTPTAAWRVAFDAAKDDHLMVIQHLLLGMNAHINLDLGIATAEVSGGVLTSSLRRDFDRLNIILQSLVETVQVEIKQVAPVFQRFEVLQKYIEDLLVNTGIAAARTQAWHFAGQLVNTPYEGWDKVIAQRDEMVGQLGSVVGSPNINLLPLIRIVNQEEVKDIRAVVSVMSSESCQRTIQFRIEELREAARISGIHLPS